MQEVGVIFRTQTKGLLQATSLHKMCVRKDNGRRVVYCRSDL